MPVSLVEILLEIIHRLYSLLQVRISERPVVEQRQLTGRCNGVANLAAIELHVRQEVQVVPQLFHVDSFIQGQPGESTGERRRAVRSRLAVGLRALQKFDEIVPDVLATAAIEGRVVESELYAGLEGLIKSTD